ncbi:MAG: radical SAM protein, partial [Patescibacteria group bacterium]|nr:radical SAM protein [Patescibacteria group bacterium]
MLEPLHACNLRCAGCGRVREYADTMGQRLSVSQCLSALEECGAPIVSVCGGEPLIYPEIEQLTGELLARRKHVYLCTNGVLLQHKLSGFPRSQRLMINVHLDGMEATHDAAACRQGV